MKNSEALQITRTTMHIIKLSKHTKVLKSRLVKVLTMSMIFAIMLGYTILQRQNQLQVVKEDMETVPRVPSSVNGQQYGPKDFFYSDIRESKEEAFQANFLANKMILVEKRLKYIDRKMEELSCRMFDIGTRGGFCLTKDKLAVGGNWEWDKSLAYHLEDLLDNQVVGDFGAGLGWYGRLFLRKTQQYLHTSPTLDDEWFVRDPLVQELLKLPQRVKSWTGYDGAVLVSELTGGLVIYKDFSEPIFINRKFDWIVSLEVGEHIPVEFEQNFLDNLERHACKGIILSWAVPDQEGHHHVNNRPRDYVIQQMEDRGFLPEELWANHLRQIVSIPWFEDTIMVFSRRKYWKHPLCPKSPNPRPKPEDHPRINFKAFEGTTVTESLIR